MENRVLECMVVGIAALTQSTNQAAIRRLSNVCWASNSDGGPKLNRQWVNVSHLAGIFTVEWLECGLSH